MNNSKDNKLDMTYPNPNENNGKKCSLPLIFGTGAIIFAGVITSDINIGNQIVAMLNNQISVYEEESQNSADAQSVTNQKKKSTNRFNAYVRNSSGEMFYDSDAEDDEAYYGRLYTLVVTLVYS
jgi:hypothetical protein